MPDRFDYIESSPGVKNNAPPESKTFDSDKPPAAQTLARYDFSGTGPRKGINLDSFLFREAASLVTRGERITPVVIKIAWIILRLALGLGILYFVLQGNTFDCAGSQVSFR